MDKKPFEYGNHVTKDMIEEVLNDIVVHKKDKKRDFTFRVFFNNQKEADDWMEMFNKLIKEEIKIMNNE